MFGQDCWRKTIWDAGLICFELKFGDKTCDFMSLYRSSTQNQNDSEAFAESSKLDLENLVQSNRS